jgi:hypothetical protein
MLQWSRFSGGSGAPFWTLAACGIDPLNMTATQSSILHCEYPLAHAPDPASLPAMIWSTNYGRLAAQTIFTLFFAGRDFAPQCIIDDQNIQDYLQTHFIDAFCRLAEKIAREGDLFDECVIGWDSMNEPFEGLIGWDNLNVNPTQQGSTLKKGTHPTPAQSLRLGMGQAQTVENWSFGAMGPSRDGTVTIDPKGRKIWADPDTERDGVHPKWGWKRDPGWKLGRCIWAQHGVWDVESGFILWPDYFNAFDGQVVEFITDYWRPHWLTFSKRIRAHHPEAIMFIQPPVFALPPRLTEEELLGRAAYSAHYYDGLTLITRHWNWFNADALGLLRGKYKSTLEAVKIGESAIRKSLQEQLAMLQGDATIIGSYPTIIGEIGTPFDMDDKRSYGWTDHGRYKGDYSRQQKALDASLNAADGGNGLNWTVWTYCPDSTHAWGDGWNMEDLSLWSADDVCKGDEKRGGSMYRMGDESDARLLRSNVSMMAGANGANPSSLTLTTPPMLGALMYEEQKAHFGSMDRWASNPYEFLTNGARAVKAFCRPWPTKIVGLPRDIKFEIDKAAFKLVVGVRSEDEPVVQESGFESDAEMNAKRERLATEIYVPLVHYAHPRFLKRTLEQSLEEDVVGSPDSSRSPSLRNVSSINLVPLSREASQSVGTLNQIGSPPPSSPPVHMLDLVVTASHGRWEVEGQTLKWWYPVPKEGEAEREYTIEITRAGGPIKDGEANATAADRLGWLCEQCCPSSPEACLLM